MTTGIELSRQKKILFAALAILIGLSLVEAGTRLAEAVLTKTGPGRRFVEGGMRIADAVLGRSGPRQSYDLSIYPDKGMARTLYEENAQTETKTVLPYSGWGPKEFEGKYIHVDRDHVRRTWNPEPSAAKRVSIFVFGGSTAWGYGARDEYTIPSHLSKLLNGGPPAGTTYFVRNYSEGAYTLMQAAVRLLTLLEAGEKPDYLIFYGGLNEVNAVYETGVPGVAGANQSWKNFFEQRVLASSWDRIRAGAADFAVEHCKSCEIAIRTVRYLFPAPPPKTFFQAGIPDADEKRIAEIAAQTAGDYQDRFVPFLNRLASAFGTKAIIFWQPTLSTESKRVGEEKLLGRIDPSGDDPTFTKLLKETQRHIHSDTENNFYDISDALAERTKECYVDFVHISEDCNQMVARKMVGILRARYLH